MSNHLSSDFLTALAAFDITGVCTDLTEVSHGHIHRTYIGQWSSGERYVHQRLNGDVFPNLSQVTSNIDRVLAHLREKLERQGPLYQDECVLRAIPVLGGGKLSPDAEGKLWRTFSFIPDTVTFDTAQRPDVAYDAARMFGRFQARLRDLPVGSLIAPIPRFMDSLQRYKNLIAASDTDSHKRKSLTLPELNRFAHFRDLFRLLSDDAYGADLQRRATHGDMKLNNLLFASKSQKPICVIDLDTCMEGSYLYDLGDFVRIACATAPEDEADLSRIDIDMEMLQGALTGYAETMADSLTVFEKERAVDALVLLPLTIGSRFLADYLQGDKYFRTHYDDHNLVRARAQLALAEKMEAKRSDLKRLTAKTLGSS